MMNGVRPNPPVVRWKDQKSVSSETVTIKKPRTCYSMIDKQDEEHDDVSNNPILISTKETVNLTLKHDGAVANFDLVGYLSLHLFNDHDGCFQLQIETGGDPRIRYETPTRIMDRDLYSRANILALLDKQDSWPATCDETVGNGIFKWRMPNAVDESLVPLKITCSHSVSDNDTYVKLQYEASKLFEPLQDVVISIPIPAFQEVRNVQNTDGEWRYYFKKRVLEWSITRIDDTNCSGSLAFCIPVETDRIEFSPISVQFTSRKTFGDVKVVKVLPLRANDLPEITQKKQPTHFTESFQLV